MEERYVESNESKINSLLRRVYVLEQQLKQWTWVVLILDISVCILGIAFIISKLG